MITFFIYTLILGIVVCWLGRELTVRLSFILITKINNNLLNRRGLKHLLAYWKVINW
jgi:hypothetical protein